MTLTFLFDVCSGVLQGCPLSALLFNFAIDPILWVFAKVKDRKPMFHTFACADDIAASISELRFLKTLANIFSRFQPISGLTLQSVKCVLILTSVVASPTNIASIRTWLRLNIPEWENMSIANHGKYLGVVLGPRANKYQWVEAIAKYKGRVEQLKLSGEPAAYNIYRYNSTCVQVMLYIAQIFPPPSNTKNIEIAALNSIMHFATNSFSIGSYMSFSSSLDIKLQSLESAMKASMFRTSIKTLTNIEDQVRHLRSSGWKCTNTSLARVANDDICNPPGWDTEPIALHLLRSRVPAINNDSSNSLNSLTLRASSGNVPNLQKKAYSIFRESIPNDWIALLKRRLDTLAPGWAMFAGSGGINSLSEIFLSNLARQSLSCRIICLRTIGNSWATSFRYNENSTGRSVYVGAIQTDPSPRRPKCTTQKHTT